MQEMFLRTKNFLFTVSHMLNILGGNADADAGYQNMCVCVWCVCACVRACVYANLARNYE